MRGAVGLPDRQEQARPGAQQVGAFRKGDRTQQAARVVIDSTGEQTTVTVEPWDARAPKKSPAGSSGPPY